MLNAALCFIVMFVIAYSTITTESCTDVRYYGSADLDLQDSNAKLSKVEKKCGNTITARKAKKVVHTEDNSNSQFIQTQNDNIYSFDAPKNGIYHDSSLEAKIEMMKIEMMSEAEYKDVPEMLELIQKFKKESSLKNNWVRRQLQEEEEKVYEVEEKVEKLIIPGLDDFDLEENNHNVVEDENHPELTQHLRDLELDDYNHPELNQVYDDSYFNGLDIYETTNYDEDEDIVSEESVDEDETEAYMIGLDENTKSEEEETHSETESETKTESEEYSYDQYIYDLQSEIKTTVICQAQEGEFVIQPEIDMMETGGKSSIPSHDACIETAPENRFMKAFQENVRELHNIPRCKEVDLDAYMYSSH